MNENLDKVVAGAVKLGCKTTNVGAVDFEEGRKHIILGVFWQIVRVGLLKGVADLSSKFNSELSLPPEQILLMWLNHHLKVSGVNRVATNFGEDLKDSVILTHVLNQLQPEQCDLAGLDLPDSEQRAESLLVNADKLGCRKFISAEDIVKGNARVNLAFVATLFSKYPEMGLSGRALELFEDNKKLKIAYKELAQEKVYLHEQFMGEIERLKDIIRSERKDKEDTDEKFYGEIGRLKDIIRNERKEKEESDEKFTKELEELKEQLKVEKEQREADEQKWANERKDLEEEIDLERKLKQDALDENEKLKEQLEAALERIRKLEAKVEKLKAERDRLNAQISSLQKILERMCKLQSNRM